MVCSRANHEEPLHTSRQPGAHGMGLLQKGGEEKVCLGTVHLRGEKTKRGNLSSQLPFPVAKVHSMGVGSPTLLGSVI